MYFFFNLDNIKGDDIYDWVFNMEVYNDFDFLDRSFDDEYNNIVIIIWFMYDELELVMGWFFLGFVLIIVVIFLLIIWVVCEWELEDLFGEVSDLIWVY